MAKSKKNGAQKNGAEKATTKGVATETEVQATCLPDGTLVPEDMNWIGGTQTIIDHLRARFEGARAGFDNTEEDLKSLNEEATDELGLRPHLESIRALFPSLTKSLDDAIITASPGAEDAQHTVDRLWPLLGPLHASANLLGERVGSAWMDLSEMADDDDENPGWLVTVSNTLHKLWFAVEVGYAALTVARLRAGEPVRSAV
jgi:hypothetical protein